MASKMGPEHRGPGPRQDGTGLGQGAPSWDKSRAPVLTVHRGEGVCFAVHIHGEAEEREQRGRRRRVASQTQLQDLRRKGRDGGGVSRCPAAAGRTGVEGAALRSPRGLLRDPPEFATAAAATSHRLGSGLGGQQNGPEAAGRAGGTWGRMALAATAARAEAGRGRRLAQFPWNLVIREAAVGEDEALGRPEGAGLGAGPLQVPVSWRSWQRSSNPWVVRAGAFGRGERKLGPRPRKRQAHSAAAEGPGGREGAERRRQYWAGPRWVAAARRLGRRLEPRLPVCVSLKAAKPPPDPLLLPALGDG